MTIDDGRDKSQFKSRSVARRAVHAAFWIIVLALAGMAVQGYHPGAEDDGVYLAAIHADLNPALFPHDSEFFRVQLQASIYDRFMAGSVRLLHLPVSGMMLAWQFAALCLVLYACLRIARRLFASEPARWAAVTLVAMLFALPVAGTALFLVDPQLHPRTLATALILIAAELVLIRRPLWSVPLLIAAALLHPIMAAFGMSFCFFLWMQQWLWPLPHRDSAEEMPRYADVVALPAVATLPLPSAAAPAPPTHALGWLLDKPTPAWRLALSNHRYIFLSRWHWYEWLGVFAPVLLLAWCRQWTARRGRTALAQVAGTLVLYSAFQLAFAVVVTLVPEFIRILPLQPMRLLHLVYLLGALIAGGLIGEFVLGTVKWRWAAAFLPLAIVMVTVQHNVSPATPHLELPGFALPHISAGSRSGNDWVRAFAWIGDNTPEDAYFAVDPMYMSMPGEDYHGFRALALRSILADGIKDSAVAMQVPRLAPLWLEQSTALQGFQSFQPADFARLHAQFGVTWTILSADRDLGFDCPYRNATVKVCRIPLQ